MIIAKIRENTFQYHDDFTSWANNIFQGTIDADGYKYVLKTFYGFYKPLEDKITSLPEWKEFDFDVEKRRKVPLLVKDMKALGISDEEINNIELCDNLPALDSLPKVLGCMYVIEGATIGGQMITKKLHEVLKYDLRNGGTAFFSSYGDNVMPYWKEFGGFINKYSADTGIEEPILQSAHDTYFRFNDWLSRLK